MRMAVIGRAITITHHSAHGEDYPARYAVEEARHHAQRYADEDDG